ncbi:hypothetical protein [Halobaculum sp. D14]|uniref:hypothetical protein n=1 Tax=Halobaculum sp. D14 TaxID=3421642 RepID=UPI003EBC3D60
MSARGGSEQGLIEQATVKVVGAATTLLVGIYIYSQVIGVMPTPESSQMANATNTTIATTSQAFTLGAVALIVLMATVMLLLITGGLGEKEQPPEGGNRGNGGTPPMH